MSVNILSDKENFRKFINHLRKYVKDNDSYKIYNIYDIVMRYHYRTCYDQGSTLFVHIFKFDDEFEISVSDDELKAIIIILFHKIDLMQTNNEIEVKKESKISKENIWHFNPDLTEYLPNGGINYLYTMMRYIKKDVHNIYETTHKVQDAVEYIEDRCSYKTEEVEPLYYYKFDNGIEIELSEYNIESMVKILTDEY